MGCLGNGTSNFTKSNTTIFAPNNYSYCFWYKPVAASTTAGPSRHPCGISSEGAPSLNFDANFAWNNSDPTICRSASHRVNGGVYVRCQLTSTPAGGVWFHLCVTYDGSNVKIFYNGNQENSVAAGPQSLINAPVIFTNVFSTAFGGFDNSPLSQFAIWNVALTLAQVKAIAAGANPNTVAPGNILSYIPLDAAGDKVVGPVMTNTGCVFNRTYFNAQDGGLLLGGANWSIPTIYTEEMDGGLKIGGTNIIPSVNYTVPMSGGLLIGGQNMDSFLMTGNGSFVMREKRGSSEVKR